MHSKSKFLNALSIVVILTTMLSSMHLPTASAQRSDGIQRDYNAESGKVTRITGEGNEPVVLMGAMSSDMTSTERSDVLVERFAPEFGLVEPSEELIVADESQPEANRVVTKYQQVYQGVPVIAGELIVNASSRGALYSMNGEVAQGLSLDTQPELYVETAIDIAKMGMVKWYGGSKADYQHADASLQIFDESLLQPSDRPVELVWKMEMLPVNAGQPIRELVLVSAKTGNIPLHFNQVDTTWHDTKAEPVVEAQDEVPPTETPTPEPTETPLPTEFPALGLTPMPSETPVVIEPTPMTEESVSAASEGDVSATANTLYVDVTTGSDANPCTLALPCYSIQQAVNVAAPGDTVMIADGTYYRPSLNAAPGVVLLNKALTLSGGWKNNFTEQTGVSIVDGEYGVSGSNKNNVGFLVTAGPSTIDRFIVQNSTSNDSGGIYVHASSLTVKNSSIINNHAANNGAGIFTINNSILDVQNSTISGNASNSGAGIYITNGSLTINNSTIAFNSAGSSGGGITISAGTATIRNSILANNSATGAAPDCSGAISSSDHNIIQTISGCTVTSGTGDLFNVDPKLDASLSGIQQIHRLLISSPAIDAGDEGSCLASDQVGNSRPYDSVCDIGAYEYSPQGGMDVVDGSGQMADLGNPFALPLQVYVFDTAMNPAVGVTVTFSAPAVGASGVFATSGTYVTTVVTDETGKASSGMITANNQGGNYSVTASVEGTIDIAVFTLTNDGPLYVSPAGSDANSCETVVQPCATLNEAIQKAAATDTIRVAVGTYTTASGPYVANINKNLTLSGGWDTSFSERTGFSTIDGQSSKTGVGVGVNNVVIEYFVIQNGGRGIYNQGTLIVNNSTIQNNRASLGGAGIYSTGALTLRNVTLTGNLANTSFGLGGGGIYQASNKSLTILNSTIVYNSEGGGISDQTSGTITVRNSIIANNSPYDCSGTINVSDHNILGNSTGCTRTSSTNDQVNIDPRVSPFPIGPLHPIDATSPALDAGDPLTCLAIDQRGLSRPQFAACDIGAYEKPTSVGPAAKFGVLSGSDQRSGLNQPFGQKLSLYVTDADGDAVENALVTFTAPLSGASGTFVDTQSNVTSGYTVDGVFTAPTFTANGQLGSYQVMATVGGASGSVPFNLSNAGLFVSPTGNNSNTCDAPTAPCLTIGSAINKAKVNDTVHITAGTYISTSTLSLTKDLNLSGGWNESFTIQTGISTIDANKNSGLLIWAFGPAELSIDHLEIINSLRVGSAGAGLIISPEGASMVKLRHVTVANNKGLDSAGAGIYISPNVTVELDHSSVYGNRNEVQSSLNGYGAGVLNYGNLTVLNSYIGDNQAAGHGAGIYNLGSLTIRNSTLINNVSGQKGGALYTKSNNPNSVSIINSTMAMNTASQGGGLYIDSASSASVTVRNSIIGANLAGGLGKNCYGTINSASKNLFDDVSNCTLPAGSYLTGDPKFSPFGVGNPRYLPISSLSPAVDAGDTATCLLTDQRGVTRPQGSTCDIGAYEYMAPGIPALIAVYRGSNQTLEPGQTGQSLAVYVLDSNGNPLADVPVTFTAPGSGASGKFSNGSNVIHVTTNEYGIADSTVYTANTIIGSYVLTANTSGVGTPASFSIKNIAWYVKPDGTDNPLCGTSVDTACQSIDYAMTRASAGETLYVEGSTFTATTNSVVTVSKQVNIKGGWNASFTSQDGFTTLDGELSRRGLMISDGIVTTIDRFIIQNGQSPISGQYGGGILNAGSLTLNKSLVQFNDDVGVYSFGPQLVVNNSAISHNINTHNSGTYHGGGMQVHGTAVINNSTINNNSAPTVYIGGNLYATYGGGIYSNGNLTINNSTIVNNSAHETGGIYRSSGMLVVKNSIISNNIAFNNGAPDCSSINVAQNSIIGNAKSCAIVSGTGNQFDTNPLISPLAFGVPGYFPISSNSPAKDNGDPATCQPTDQRGLSRPQGITCDIGAYEYATSGPVVTVALLGGSNQLVSPGKTFPVPFNFYALDANGSPVANVEASFTAPLTGPSGTFAPENNASVVVMTSEFGVAESPAFRANDQLGSYDVLGMVSGSPLTTVFTVGNVYWYVSTAGDDRGGSNNCTVSSDPCATIDNAIGHASSSGIIFVGDGRYSGEPTNDNLVNITKNVDLSGGWNHDFTAQVGQTIIDSDSGRGIFVDVDVTASIDRFDVTGGYLVNNFGGGILNGGALTFTNGSIYNNVAHGVNIDARISSDGGGIYSNGTELTLTNVTISNNEADTGGGIFIDSGNTILNNVTITQNLATNIGVTAYGGGIENKNNSPITISNTIIAGNSAEVGQDCYNQLTSGGYNLIGYDADCDITPAAGDLIGHFNPLNAGLGDLSDNNSSTKTHALLTGSLAIDAGDPATCAPADQRGAARPQGAACDIGAFEGTSAQTATVNAKTYSAGGQMKWPGDLLCDASTSTCTNGADTTADAAHKLAIDTYEFYLIKHGRLGIDNNNMPIISTVHYCASKGCPYFNANWTGAQMIYGDGYGFAKTDDIVAHELTHGVTQFESNLYYYYQSGAINESFSDLWGEYFDQINLYGNDSAKVKWLVGEDLIGHGAFRNMKNPPQFKHPDKMTSTLYHNKSAYSKDWDNGGVHTNSGINNKAVYLMVDGGIFNGKTVTALGWKKVSAIYYEAQTNILTSGSDYSDLYFALQQACTNLLGQHGITSATCTEVKDAITAVQMNSQPVTNYNPDAPLCPTGTTTGTQITLFEDSFENGASNWNMTSNWGISSFDAADGSHHVAGNDSYALTDNTLTMQVGVPIPAGTQLFLHFKHSYGFSHNPGEYYDGAILEYSTNDGITWQDAKPLFSAGQNYMGTIFKYPSYVSEYGSALQGRAGFVGDSHGYVSSRYNLTSLAGKTVKFRWRFATDWDYDYMGWHLDDISIYQCVGTPSVPVLQLPVNNALVKNYAPLLDWSNAKYAAHYELQVATDSGFTSFVYNESNVPASQFQVPTDLNSNTKYYWRVRGVNGIGQTGKWTTARMFRTVVKPPELTSPVDGFDSMELRPLFDWDAPEGPGALSGYTIQIASDSQFKKIVHTGNPTTSSYVPNKDLPKNVTLYWRVQAKGENGPSLYTSYRMLTTPVNPPPALVLVSPVNNGVLTNYTNPVLKWKPVTFLDASFGHYQVQLADNPDFSEPLVNDVTVTSRLTTELITNVTLVPNTAYYWRVRAVNVDNEVSNWSTVWTLRAAIPATTLTLPANGETNVSRKPLLDWEDVPGNNGYVLQVWKGTTLVKSVTLPPDVSEYQFVTNLLANTSYTWKVQTKGNVASSTWSQFTFKTGSS